MIAYPDTGFLCSLYRKQIHTPLALAHRARIKEPLYFTSLIEFEFIQAIRLQVWMNAADRTKGYSELEADQMIADWESDVAAGVDMSAKRAPRPKDTLRSRYSATASSSFARSLVRPVPWISASGSSTITQTTYHDARNAQPI